MKYIKEFSDHQDYSDYIENGDLPNVSYCDSGHIHYNPKVKAIIEIRNTYQSSGEIRLYYDRSSIAKIFINDVEYTGTSHDYNISAGDHVFKYQLKDQRILGNTLFQICAGLIGSDSEVIIPDTVTSMGTVAFAATGVNNITIPGSVKFIGDGCFASCSYLENITFLSKEPPVLGSTQGVYQLFHHSSYLSNIYVPAESVEAYKAAPGWSNYASKIKAIQ